MARPADSAVERARVFVADHYVRDRTLLELRDDGGSARVRVVELLDVAGPPTRVTVVLEDEEGSRREAQLDLEEPGGGGVVVSGVREGGIHYRRRAPDRFSTEGGPQSSKSAFLSMANCCARVMLSARNTRSAATTAKVRPTASAVRPA